ncbi:TPA: GAF domain-containing protein, partial [Candidatus Poribacteria bacterium]|nr:GAF domain-containing protein [Candidatus Poribacteria bacterium]HEX29242.1 GAF domain-containing protein [Candidatus Poribacteria bacterium]
MREIYELLHPFLQVIAVSLKAGRVSIVTPNGDGTISPKVGLGLPGRAYKPALWDIGRVSAYVMETRTPLLTNGLDEGETRFKLNRSGYNGSSFISAPLIVNGDIWGVINLSDKEDGTSFDENDLRKLSEHISALTEFIKRITALRFPSSPGPDDPIIEEKLVGRSEKIIKVRQLLKTLSGTDMTVFVKGETGTGKSLVAKLLHDLSPRSSKPFVKVNCAALPETLLEAELFGYERGAFTGAFE